MLHVQNSIADILPYDVWLEIFSYFSFAASFDYDQLALFTIAISRTDSRRNLALEVYLTIVVNLQAKCMLRLVSKEFKYLTNSIFYEALMFNKWEHVTDLVALVECDPYIKETLSRSTKRIDFPSRSEFSHEFDSIAALLLKLCPQVVHLSYSAGRTSGPDFLQQMRIIGLGPKLRVLDLTDSYYEMIIPFLRYFSNIEVLLCSGTFLIDTCDTSHKSSYAKSEKYSLSRSRQILHA